MSRGALPLPTLSTSNTSAFSSSKKRKYTVVTRHRHTAAEESSTNRGDPGVTSVQENLEDDVELCSNLSIGHLTPIKTHNINSPTMTIGDSTTLSSKSAYDNLHRSSSDVSSRSYSTNSCTSAISPTFCSVASDMDMSDRSTTPFRCSSSSNSNPIYQDNLQVSLPEDTRKLQQNSCVSVGITWSGRPYLRSSIPSSSSSSGPSVTPLIGDFTAIHID